MDYINEYMRLKQALFQKVYANKFNDCQSAAIFQTEGPVLVLAGAGSGKTTVLVHRIAFILKYGNAYYERPTFEVTEEDLKGLQFAYDHFSLEQLENEILPSFACSTCHPRCILAITFTNKAANEIQERIASVLQNESASSSIVAGTFHSVCASFLRVWAEKIGLQSNFTIYDPDDKRHVIQDIMEELQINDKELPIKSICNFISHYKDSLQDPGQVQLDGDPKTKAIVQIYARYEALLLKYNALDFDDLILKTVRLLETCQEAFDYYNDRFHYVSIDEYQDTNAAQFRLAELLTAKRQNLMVVGDDDQSIYRFRGATVENILSFDKTFPKCAVIKLEQNYRSTQTILQAANAVISNNETRHQKELWTDGPQGEPIHVYLADNAVYEASFIVDEIFHKMVQEGYKYKDFAVLYRNRDMARTLEAAFVKSGLKYRIIGGFRFYERKEIKDLLAYLHVILNPSDDTRLKRIINEPKRGIGDACILALSQIATLENCSMLDAIGLLDSYPQLSRYKEKLYAFRDLITPLQNLTVKPSELIRRVFIDTGYKAMLDAEGEVSQVKIDSVEELISAAVEFEKKSETEEKEATLAAFLEEISLVSDVDSYDDDENAVSLMTMHSAKGLEFPIVFLPGWEENIFPSQLSLNSAEIGEERRLAYVAITRAKKEVYILRARNRLQYGHESMNLESRFLREIPQSIKQPAGRRIKEAPSPTVRTPQPQTHTPRYNQELDRHYNTASNSSKARTTLLKLEPGDRVLHVAFGTGTIEEVTDLVGDYLYKVQFDNPLYGSKKLMASFAKLQKIQ